MRLFIVVFVIFFTFHTKALLANAFIHPGCAGTVFKMPGMTNDQKALIITAGHCLNIGSRTIHFRQFLGTDEVIIDRNFPRGLSSLYKDGQKKAKPHIYRKILFATMSGVDLAILQLDVTYKQLKKEGYTVYSIAETFPHHGQIIEFDSVWMRQRPGLYEYFNICEVDRIIPRLTEEGWSFENVVRLKAGGHCIVRHGQSGTAGIPPKSKIIYVILSTATPEYNPDNQITIRRIERLKPCGYDYPCEVYYNPFVEIESVLYPRLNSQNNRTGPFFNQAYAAPVAGLHDCFDRNLKAFNFRMPSCTLNPKQ